MSDAAALPPSLENIYRGWDGYQTSLVNAVAPLTPEQLAFCPAPGLRTVGELARHIAAGRVNWFLRMNPPGGAELAVQFTEWTQDSVGNRYLVEDALPATSAEELVHLLKTTWKMVDATLTQWTIADLERTYRHTYQGKTYAVSYQWTIWRILLHDVHHGGQLSLALYLQGIEPTELGWLGGHLTEPPLAEP